MKQRGDISHTWIGLYIAEHFDPWQLPEYPELHERAERFRRGEPVETPKEKRRKTKSERG